MAAIEDYVVNYQVNVQAQTAIETFNKIKVSVDGLSEVSERLKAITGSINSFSKACGKLQVAPIELKINTAKAEASLERVLGLIEKIKAGSNINLSVNGGGTSGATRARNEVMPMASSRKSNQYESGRFVSTPVSTYRALGNTMVDSGGLMAVDMLKGFGFAYGITGLMSAMNSIVKTSAEFENITKTTEDILKAHDTAPNFDKRFGNMVANIRNVAKDTKFTTTEAAQSGQYMAQSGLTMNEIKKSIRPAANIALIGDTKLDAATNALTDIMLGYKIKADQMDHVADVLTMTSTRSKARLIDLAESMKYAGSILGSLKVPFEESTAALGILGSAGMRGSQGGTAMRQIVMNLTHPTKNQQLAWKKIGVSQYDKTGNLRDLVDIFSDLHNKGFNANIAGYFFRTTAANAAVRLSDEVNKWNQIISENFMSQGISNKIANDKENVISGLWAQLTSNFEDNGITVFKEMQPKIEGLLKSVINWLATPEATERLRNIAEMIFKFAKMIWSVTSDILAIINKLWPVLDFWAEWQLKIFGVIAVLRTFRGILTTSGWFIPYITKIGEATKAMWTFGKSIFGVYTSQKALDALSVFPTAAGVGGKKATEMLVGAGEVEAGAVVAGGAGAAGGGAAALGGISATGIGLIAVALGAASYGLISWNSGMNEAIDLRKKLADQDRVINGMGVGSNAIVDDQYLQIHVNHWKDLNGQLQEYMDKKNKIDGMVASGNGGTQETKIKDLSDEMDRLKPFVSGYWSRLFTSSSNSMQAISPYLGHLNGRYDSAIGRVRTLYGKVLPQENATYVDRLYGAAYLSKLGGSMSTGSEALNLRSYFERKFMTAGNMKEFNAVTLEFNRRMKSIVGGIDHRYDTVGASEIGNLTVEQRSHTYAYAKTLASVLTDAFYGGLKDEQPNIAKKIADIRTMIGELAQGLAVDTKTFQSFLYNSTGIPAFDPKKVQKDMFGATMMRYMGADFKTKSFKNTEQAQLFVDLYGSEQMAISKTDSKTRNKLETDFNKQHPYVKAFVANARKMIGEHTPADEKQKPSPYHAKDFQDLGKKPGENGAGESAYKSHYGENAAPKQIIVRINNLMNIDKIDMTNPHMAQAVHDIKEALAQTLDDVVADFTSNMG